MSDLSNNERWSTFDLFPSSCAEEVATLDHGVSILRRAWISVTGFQRIGALSVLAVVLGLSACARNGPVQAADASEKGQFNAMNENCISKIPDGFELLPEADAKSFFAHGWVELVYAEPAVTSSQHERFDAVGNYGLIGGRAPYQGHYKINGAVLSTTIEGGPEAHRQRNRLLLRARAGGGQLFIQECGSSTSPSAVTFVIGE